MSTDTKQTKHRITGALNFLLSQKKDDLSVRQLSVMMACVKKKQTVRGLAAALGISRPAVTRAVDKLEEAGLMERTRDTTDNRSVDLTLTKSGVQFAANFS